MTRPTASEQLSAWIDGELTDAEAAELEAELARDPSLRAELEELESVVRILHDEGPAEAPAGFHERVLARVEQDFPARGGFDAWIRRPFGVPLEGWTLGAAALAVVMLTLLPALRRAPDPIGGEPAAIEVRSLPTEGTSLPRDAPVPPKLTGEAKSRPSRPTIEPQGTAAPEDEIQIDEIVPIVEPPVEPPPRVLDSYDGRQRFVAQLTDESMKRTVLAYLSRWGGATDADGAEVDAGMMTSSREDLLLTIPQDELPAFTNGLDELRRQGIDVRWVPQQDLVRGATIRIVVSLELVAE